MSCLAHLSSAGFQGLMTLPCDLWENLWLLTPLCLRWQRHSYPLPKFSIGDLVAENWIDEFDNEVTDFGEIMGLCYLPEDDFDYPAHTWVYFVYWTRTTCGADSSYPCFSGVPTKGDELRLIKQF